MIEADRILEPVAPDAAPIRGLREYTNSATLADALRGTLGAIEQSLRLLLRSDRGAGEQDRMRAMSPQELPFEQLVERLRARDRISIQLAGTLHELRRRVESSGPALAPGPPDADRALELIARLRREVQEQQDAPVREAAHHAVVAHPIEQPKTKAVRPAATARPAPNLAGVGASILALLLALFLVWRGLDDPFEEGIEAFREGELTEAVRHFRAAVEDDEENPTPRLYLGRVYRRLGRHEEAGDQLRRAATLAPRDADIRRELGYLFLDLGSYAAAIRQFEQAVELEPEGEASWIGLVRAMRLGNDPRSESTLARAPANARALLARESAGAPTDAIE